MVDTEQKSTEMISCEICLKEVPRSDAKMAEVDDYVAYFCGLDCYDKWRHQNGDKA